MDFPKTFEEFAEQYQIVDTKEVYTNGVELIPVFRVQQWLDHIKEEKNMKEMTGREFISIESIYVPDEICPYEEYKGKPYYSIRYKENGTEREGYSTYNLDILSDFLKCYFFRNGEEVVGNGRYFI